MRASAREQEYRLNLELIIPSILISISFELLHKNIIVELYCDNVLALVDNKIYKRIDCIFFLNLSTSMFLLFFLFFCFSFQNIFHAEFVPFDHHETLSRRTCFNESILQYNERFIDPNISFFFFFMMKPRKIGQTIVVVFNEYEKKSR